MRIEAARQRANQNRLLMGAGAFLVVIVAGFIYLGTRAQAGEVGEPSYESMGNSHIEYGQRSPVAYNSTPPSSGPHYGNLAAWEVYEEPIRYEQLNHNLEDGGMVVYYQCEDACPELVEQLTESVEPYVSAGRHVSCGLGNLLYVAYYWGVDAALTFYHDYSGFVFFAVVLLLLLP